MTFLRRCAASLLLSTLLVGCATVEVPTGPQLPPDLARRPGGNPAQPWPATLDEADVRDRIARLLPGTVKDRPGWALDLYMAFAYLKIPHASETYCATMAVIEQESSFQADPAVPGLPGIVHKELDRRADKYGIPKLLISAAMLKTSPDGRSYDERIDALKTEKQLDTLFQDMIGELPFGKQLLADYNPVHTAGPMQVSVAFAEQHVQQRPYPYPIAKTLRDEVFTRRGGLYFGSAIVLDYPAPYDDVVFRFADFNAGRYASRNVAFQAALGRYAGKALTLDGDLLRYEDGKPADAPSQVETMLRSVSGALRMSAPEIRRDLLLEKSAGFGQSPLYQRVFVLAEQATGTPMPRQAMPNIDLKSPKIVRKLTTEWFARRVDERYRKCLARADAASL
ncbi:MAG TPA: DUF1615 domain-containing protein [Rhodocyclaceae bacterium]|nr:DUF1615 domain-containing protein [Rhodocyclaceae bacterium]